MPKIGDAEFDRVIVRLFKGDRDRLAAAYPQVGYNAVVRTLVRKHIKRLDELTARRLPNDHSTDPELDLAGEPGEPALSD